MRGIRPEVGGTDGAGGATDFSGTGGQSGAGTVRVCFGVEMPAPAGPMHGVPAVVGRVVTIAELVVVPAGAVVVPDRVVGAPTAWQPLLPAGSPVAPGGWVVWTVDGQTGGGPANVLVVGVTLGLGAEGAAVVGAGAAVHPLPSGVVPLTAGVVVAGRPGSCETETQGGVSADGWTASAPEPGTGRPAVGTAHAVDEFGTDAVVDFVPDVTDVDGTVEAWPADAGIDAAATGATGPVGATPVAIGVTGSTTGFATAAGAGAGREAGVGGGVGVGVAARDSAGAPAGAVSVSVAVAPAGAVSVAVAPAGAVSVSVAVVTSAAGGPGSTVGA